MIKCFVRSVFVIAVVAVSFMVNTGHAQAAAPPVFCAPGAMMKIYRQAYAASNDAVVSVAAVQSTLNDFPKVDGVLSRFIVTAADGKLIKEISTVTANTKGFVIDPKTLRSAKSVNFFKNVELGHTPMASSLLDGYDRLAMLTSVVGLGLNLSTALQTGDPLDHAKVTKDVVDLGSALALTYRGWQGLQLAFSSVGFIDYALNSLITAQYAQYDEYWWQGYRSYMDARFPKMVTGNNSWAALVTRGDNGKAFQARLTEFWSEKDTDDGLMSPADRAQHYYKVPSPFQRDALAGATDKYKQAFAARYYKDTLQTTIETYLKRQNKAFIEEARDRLETSTGALCDYLSELSTLQVKVAKFQKAEMNDKAKDASKVKSDDEEKVASLNVEPLKRFTIEATQGTYDGPGISAALPTGTIVAFRATVPLTGKNGKGKLEWQLLAPSGVPVLGAMKSKEIDEAEGVAEAKFRIQLVNLEPGTYKARLTHRISEQAVQPRSDTFSFDIGQAPTVTITRLWVTDKPKNETHFSKLEPEQTPVLYVAFDMSDGMDVVQRKLLVRDISTGDIVVTSEGEKKRKGESTEQRTGIALEAWQLEPGEKYRFEATLTIPDGASVTQSQNFEIAEIVAEKKVATNPVPAPKEKLQPELAISSKLASSTPNSSNEPSDKEKENWQNNKVYKDLKDHWSILKDDKDNGIDPGNFVEFSLGRCLSAKITDAFLTAPYKARINNRSKLLKGDYADRKNGDRCRGVVIELYWENKTGRFIFTDLSTFYRPRIARPKSGDCYFDKNKLSTYMDGPNSAPTKSVSYKKTIEVNSPAEGYDLQTEICFAPDKFIARYLTDLPQVGLNPVMPSGCDGNGYNCTINPSRRLN